MKENFPATNPVFMMVNSGARGNWMQVRQIAGMRGLVANPKGEIIPRPIKSNYREGLSVLEYFIATHGARKGLADTALRTADSGYLTRRLVDVSQDVIIREEDCGTDRGLPMPIGERGEDGVVRPTDDVDTSAVSRILSEDVTVDGEVLATAGTELSITLVERLCLAGVTSVRLRSVLTCDSKVVTCATCYGRSLATGKLVDVGEAIGIIAAQSIGEPGTQLTMRTFHTGGVAGEDITHGLPRIVELFEARTPKGVAPISEATGRVRIEETDRSKTIVIVPDDGSAEQDAPDLAPCAPDGHRGRPRRGRPAADRRCGGPQGPCCGSSASGPCSCTWSTRCRRCTARRACRSTTSTSRSSCARCSSGSRSSTTATRSS